MDEGRIRDEGKIRDRNKIRDPEHPGGEQFYRRADVNRKLLPVMSVEGA